MFKLKSKKIKRRVVKTRTNCNELCKQYQYVLDGVKGNILYTKKYILCDPNHQELKKHGFKELKTVKGVSLYGKFIILSYIPSLN